MFKIILTAVTASLLLVLSAATAHADELTLYIYPSPGLNWSKPATVARDTIRNSVAQTPRSIGHVSVEVTCEGATPFHVLTGMSQISNREPAELLFFRGFGFGILFHDYQGELEDETHLRPELETRYQSGKLSFITTKINSTACRRLQRYVTEYRERGYDRHYGLPNRPLYGEGAGCSAFGTSFLEVAGILDREQVDNWSQLRRVPREIIGGSMTGAHVPLAKVLATDQWACKEDPHEQIFFWDPDLMHAWTVKTWNQEMASPSGRFQTLKRGNAVGLVVDKLKVPAPTGPIWRQ